MNNRHSRCYYCH